MDKKEAFNCFDLNDANFNADLYYRKLLKEFSLKQLMDKENEIVRDAQTLHSDMQTLVYENYNKFISATETIKKMKTDFKKMESEMELLTKNMNSITSFSEQISSTLQGTRRQVSDLCCKHDILKKLQFLFKLPNQLKSLVQENNFKRAVEDFKQAEQVLIQYGDLDSFKGIREDCEKTVAELRNKLHVQLNSGEVSTMELTNCVQLLIQLDEPINDLSSEFLEQANIRLKHILEDLNHFSDCQDILEFIDQGCSGFLNDLCITVAIYNDLFSKNCLLQTECETVSNKCNTFVADNMGQYFIVIQNRIESEKEVDDSVTLVKALDKFCRKLQTANVLAPLTEFTSTGTEIVIKAARRQSKLHLNALKSYFNESLLHVKQTLTTSKPLLINATKSETSTERSYESLFLEFLTSFVTNVIEKIKGILQNLMVFLQPELLFSSKNNFRESFCVDSVREGLVVSFLHHLTATVHSYTENSVPLQLLFILSKASLQYHSTAIHLLLDLVDKWFHIDEFSKRVQLSTETELCTEMYAVAQRLINHFVKMQGLSISQVQY